MQTYNLFVDNPTVYLCPTSLETLFALTELFLLCGIAASGDVVHEIVLYYYLPPPQTYLCMG